MVYCVRIKNHLAITTGCWCSWSPEVEISPPVWALAWAGTSLGHWPGHGHGYATGAHFEVTGNSLSNSSQTSRILTEIYENCKDSHLELLSAKYIILSLAEPCGAGVENDCSVRGQDPCSYQEH